MNIYFFIALRWFLEKRISQIVILVYCTLPSFVHWVVATPLGGWEVRMGMHKT